MKCEHVDYLEIACTFRYQIRLTLVGKDVLEGTAWDLMKNQQGHECIVVKFNESSLLVPVNDIKRLDVITDGARFKSVAFSRS